MIKELTYLTPAEILLIIDPNTKIDELVSFTFSDLILKKVLCLYKYETISNNQKKDPLVIKGESFNKYKPLKHENVFINHFVKNPELKIRLSELINLSFKNVKSADIYKLKYIYSNSRMKNYFKSNLFQKIIGIKVLSDNGIKTQIEIKRELKRIRSNTSKKNIKVVEELILMKGNILLIPKIPNLILETITKFQSNNSDVNKTTFVDNQFLLFQGLSYHHLQSLNSYELEFKTFFNSNDNFENSLNDYDINIDSDSTSNYDNYNYNTGIDNYDIGNH